MGVLSFTLLVRPSAVLCASLVLLVFLFPETCDAGGKKVIPPVKHLFGVGIGYQKVVHYKPVLVISKSRRMKRPSGWGWKSGRARPKYTPLVVQQPKRGYAYGHPPPPQHRRKRKRPPKSHYHSYSHSSSSGGSSGWGGEEWQPGPGPGWRRPHRSHRKGHDSENFDSIDMHQHKQQHGLVPNSYRSNKGGFDYEPAPSSPDPPRHHSGGDSYNNHRPPHSKHNMGDEGYSNHRPPPSNNHNMGDEGYSNHRPPQFNNHNMGNDGYNNNNHYSRNPQSNHHNMGDNGYNNMHGRNPPSNHHNHDGGREDDYKHNRNHNHNFNRHNPRDNSGEREMSEQPRPSSAPNNYKVSDSPPTGNPYYYEDGVILRAPTPEMNGDDRPTFQPSQQSHSSSNYYGSPYSSIEDMEDGYGAYESEIKEQWKTDGVMTTPSPDSSTATVSPSPTPPLYPFTDHSPPEGDGDGSVTNMHRDFLKTHMKNFYQFQDYQQANTNKPRQDQGTNQFAPQSRSKSKQSKTQRPYFSTTNSGSSDGDEQGNDAQYDDDYDDKRNGDDGEVNYDDDYNGSFNELNRKMMPVASKLISTQILTTAKPTVVSNSMNIHSSSNLHPTITTMPKTDKKFKPSPRVDELTIGSSFNKPGFFPTTMQQFNKQTKMT